MSKSMVEGDSQLWVTAGPLEHLIATCPVKEMMTMLSGSVTLIHQDGRQETFEAGDTFFIAKGTACIWEITQH